MVQHVQHVILDIICTRRFQVFNSVLHHVSMVYKMPKHVYVTHNQYAQLDARHVPVLHLAQHVILDIIYQMVYAILVVLLAHHVHQFRPAISAIICTFYKLIWVVLIALKHAFTVKGI